MNFSDLINENIVCFDGAMGSLLIDKGISKDTNLSILNIKDEELVMSVHNMYVNAGADIITANTFGANGFKLNETDFSVAEIIRRGVKLARLSAGEKLVALDIGPTGYIKTGKEFLNFDYLYNIYKEQILAGTDSGADIILIETMYDIREARIAILAAKENSNLPILCTLTFGEYNKTLNGTDPRTAVHILESLGIDAIGVNCMEPERIVTAAEIMLKCSSIPVLAQPSMGIPKKLHERYNYNISKEIFSNALISLVKKGLRIVGGCCGTTPECINFLKHSVESIPILRTFPEKTTSICSLDKTVVLGNGSKIISDGFKFNKKDMKDAFENGNYDKINDIAVKQENAGAHILLVSTKEYEGDESKLLQKIVNQIQYYVHAPLMIEGRDTEAIETALRLYNGKALVSSLDNSVEHIKSLLPIIRKYGAVFVGTLSEDNGNTVMMKNKTGAVDRIIRFIKSYGIPEENIILNCKIIIPLNYHGDVFEILKTIKMINTKYNIKTILDINDITQEFYNTNQADSVFYALSLYSGLNVAIIDALNKVMIDTYNAYIKLSLKLQKEV